jgi:hypothetical protein
VDLDPAFFIFNLQDAKKKKIKKKNSAYYIFKVHLQHFSKIKGQREVTKTAGRKVFLTIFAC